MSCQKQGRGSTAKTWIAIFTAMSGAGEQYAYGLAQRCRALAKEHYAYGVSACDVECTNERQTTFSMQSSTRTRRTLEVSKASTASEIAVKTKRQYIVDEVEQAVQICVFH